MRFEPTAEQEALQRAARAFVERRLPVAHLRALRDGGDPLRLSRAVWREAAALGWAGIAIAEEHGGAGLGLVELALVMEELGRTLAPTPMLATAVLGTAALAAAAPDVQRAHLPAVAAGERLIALAFEEQRRFAPHACRTTARRDGTAFVLDGAKGFVLDGPAADLFLVTARDGEHVGVFAVPRNAPGLIVEPLALVDSRAAARVTLAGVRADPLLPPSPAAAALLDALVLRGAAALAAEMLGAAEAVFQTTLAYLKERRQFGVAIGSFQALKHRAARLFCELELTRSVVRAAVSDLARGAADADLLVHAAKARASDTFTSVAAEAIQMHGGIGVTDDLDVGLYYKRARVAAETFGGPAYHRAAYGRRIGVG